jgi:hypothetical protein
VALAKLSGRGGQKGKGKVIYFTFFPGPAGADGMPEETLLIRKILLFLFSY